MPLIDNSKHFLANLTTEPGIYQMVDKAGNILYVGKAQNLKKRVASYFKEQYLSVKTQALMKQVTSIEVTVTRSDTEALLLECNLIKALRPKYNVLMRDDKTYPYLLITNHPYPRMKVIRGKQKPKDGQYFGPYPSTSAVRETLNIMQKVFKLRNCRDSYFNHRTRPCLQYQIERCTAPCTNYISKEAYRQSVQDAVRFLQGKSQEIIKDLMDRMEQAVKLLEFEKAAQLRDQIKSLRAIQEQQSIVHHEGDLDVIAIEARPGFACVQWVGVRNGQVLANQTYYPDVPKLVQAHEDRRSLEYAIWQQAFTAFIAYFYFEHADRIPPVILTNHTIMDKKTTEALLTKLRGKACRIQSVVRSVKKRWLDFACNNLKRAMEARQSAEDLIQARSEAVMALLGVKGPTLHMECFDISHTQGGDTVASCVVFNEAGPAKQAYRRFNIQNITPGDDYAAMEQALRRRYTARRDQNKPLPDILVIDGGKGQLHVAQSVLQDLKLSQIKVLGVAKGASRKAGWEQLFFENETSALKVSPDSKALHFIQHIRDEAHRFAIQAHRKKRGKTSLNSSLESIEGIGAKRRQALLKHFGGLRALAKAPRSELVKVQGISQQLAENIYRHFHLF